jgi:serine O-acetyltransferase
MEKKSLSQYAQALESKRANHSRQLPRHTTILTFLDATLYALFPNHWSPSNEIGGSTEQVLQTLLSTLDTALIPTNDDQEARQSICHELLASLPQLYELLHEDAEAICTGDPAAQNTDEVILSYPGFLAIAVYRLAHWLHTRGVTLIPRMMTEYAHQRTGVDIHPGARIGRRFVIDHGTGIVIGETSHIHDNVKLYQGVTLGGLSIDKSMADTKRHPTIESNVIIYANATILGGETVIGSGSIIGGNVWLTSSVPANSRVYHKSEFVIKSA